MTHEARLGSVEKAHTLSDADMTSRRAVTRRSLLGTLGITAGVAAAAAFGTAGGTHAAGADAKETDKKKPKEESDSGSD